MIPSENKEGMGLPEMIDQIRQRTHGSSAERAW